MNSSVIKSILKFHFFSLIGVLMVQGCSEEKVDYKKLTQPKAEKIEKELTIHGNTRIDNYFWLRERENPKVINYLNSENQYTKKVLAHTEKFQEKLFNEIIDRIKKDDSSVPYKDNGYFYYTRYEKGNEYPIYCRKKESLDAKEEIILNVNQMAKGYDFYQLRGVSVSPDNKIAAFGVDTLSRRKYQIFFKNLETGELIDDGINNTTGSVAWGNDSKTIFYTAKDKFLRAHKIFRHTMGHTTKKDSEIYEETDPTFSCYVFKTKSDKYILIESWSTLSTEYRFLDADNPGGKFKIVHPRENDLEYYVDHYKDKFYITTNYDATNFRLMETPVNNTNKKYWKEIIPHRNGVLLEGIEIFQNYLVVEERKDGLTQIRIINWKDKSEHYINFDEETYASYIGTNPEFETDELRFGYSSLTTPNSIYDYDMNSRDKKLMKRDEVVGDFDPDNYKAERFYAESRDGVKIPISLVYKKGLKKDGNNPLLLYGYGSYGFSRDPYFNSVRLSLLDRGFVYAIAHIRGGQELGRQWYEDGKLLKKKNTFYDFIDCAEFLIDKKYTNPEKLFAMGGSAGGLLIGAVVNMRPDLWKGVVAGVPFVDVVTTMLDESIPLTTGEYDEWGNPNIKEYYDYILSYSPYDNVESKDYPSMLVTTGLHDSQVQYWEPAKWVAKLREMKTDDNMLLMHVNMEAGHSGASGRFEQYRENALEYAFILNLLDIYE